MGKGRSCREQHIQRWMLQETTQLLFSEAQGCEDSRSGQKAKMTNEKQKDSCAKSRDSPPECVLPHISAVDA